MLSKGFTNFFMKPLPLYISYLFLMLLNDKIVDIEKTDGTYLAYFVVDDFSGLFSHPSIFPIKHSKSA